MTFEEMINNHGGYIEEVSGEHRIVTRDEQGRAVVGPKTHGRPGLLGRLRKRRTRATPQDVAVTTGEIPRQHLPEPEGWLARLKWQWLTRFYDEQWHKAVQHTGVDIMIWSVGLSFSAVFIKGAWWVVTL